MTDGDVRKLKGVFGAPKKTVTIDAMDEAIQSRGAASAAYEPDGGPLTAEQVAALRKDAAADMPKGKVLGSERLFGNSSKAGK